MKKKILVTGSEGFIGSHLVEALIKKNHNVTCFVLYNSFNNLGWLRDLSKIKKKNFKVIFGDIRDSEQVRDSLKNQDVVINLAALIGIPYSYKSVRSYFETNVMGLINILEASKSLNLKKIIHVSTSEVFETQNIYQSMKSIIIIPNPLTLLQKLQQINLHYLILILLTYQ